MFGNILKSTIDIVGDVAKVAMLPVSVAVDVASAATKPIGDAAADVAKDVHESLKDD